MKFTPGKWKPKWRAAFVESLFLRYRERFGSKRTTGAGPMREAEWEGLCVLHDLKNDLMEEPPGRNERPG